MNNDRYKWIALSNATLAVLFSTLDASITLIAMPDIFRGIKLDPLVPSNSFYLLWMILGYMVVLSVLVVSLGRLGDMFGRVRIYNLGFVIYTVASLMLAIDWMTGKPAALYLIVFRIFQGVGGACLVANSAAIITDAFPANQRGMALGINNIVGVGGTFVGLVLGGLLAPISWRLVFLISVPVGVFGTVWAYLKLEERSEPSRRPVDWLGNLTFAVGLILVMVAVTYGIRPYGGHSTGWTSPKVLGLFAAAILVLVAFVITEYRVSDPMFRLPLFRIRAFTFGTLSTFLSSIARGGLMFILIIWLQGIWLPQHGYDFTKTPLYAGLYMLPLTVGLLCAGPASGYLSDRFGARWFATGGMLASALSFVLLLLLPTDFSYPVFAAILALMGISMGMFASPNRAAVMNSLPRSDRGAGGGMNMTFQNSAQVLSIGIFFTLMIIGLASSLPAAMTSGLEAHGVSAATATQRRPPPAGLDPVRSVPRLQPDPTPGRRPRARHAHLPESIAADRTLVLPEPDLGAVPQRAARGVRVRDRRLPGGSRRVADARRSLLRRRRATAAHPPPRSHPRAAASSAPTRTAACGLIANATAARWLCRRGAPMSKRNPTLRGNRRCRPG